MRQKAGAPLTACQGELVAQDAEVHRSLLDALWQHMHQLLCSPPCKLRRVIITSGPASSTEHIFIAHKLGMPFETMLRCSPPFECTSVICARHFGGQPVPSGLSGPSQVFQHSWKRLAKQEHNSAWAEGMCWKGTCSDASARNLERRLLLARSFSASCRTGVEQQPQGQKTESSTDIKLCTAQIRMLV